MDKRGEVEKNANSRYKVKKNFKKDPNYVEAKYRRLDSLARLFQGDMDCAAVCFDGDELLVAVNFMPDSYFNSDHTCQKYTNRLYAHNLFTIVKAHLMYVAQSIYDYNFKRESSYKIDYKDLLSYGDLILSIQTSKDKVKQYIHDNVNLYKDSSYFYNNVNKSLEKVTQSLIITCFDKNHEKAIDSNIFHALVNDKIRLLEPDKIIKSHNNKALHAEMIILDYLYEKYFSKNVLSNNIPIPCHIGISKPCCLTCEITLKILNEYLDNKYDNDEFNLILYRQDHDWLFPATIPLILKRENFKDAFLNKFGEFITNQINTGRQYRFIDLTGKLKDEERKILTGLEINEVTLEQAFNIEPYVRVEGYQTTYDNSDSKPLNTEEYLDEFGDRMITTEEDNEADMRILSKFTKERFGEQPASDQNKEAEKFFDKNSNKYSKDVVVKFSLGLNPSLEDTSNPSNNKNEVITNTNVKPSNLLTEDLRKKNNTNEIIVPKNTSNSSIIHPINNTDLSNNNPAVENHTNKKSNTPWKDALNKPANPNPPPMVRGPLSQAGNPSGFHAINNNSQNGRKNTNREKEDQNNRYAKK